MTLVNTVTQTLSILTIAGQALAVILILLFLFYRRGESKFWAENALFFSFIITLIATAGSLFYSEVAGYEPCKLCWFQRIFMYPQTVLLGTALYRKYPSIMNYTLPLSIIGAAIAAYHYLLQLNIAPSLPCSAVGYSVACSQRFVMSFGYITIPMMSFTAFLLLTLFALGGRIYPRRRQPAENDAST